MRKTNLAAIGWLAMALSAGIAQAGPCNTAAAKDAGSGPTTGHIGQMTTDAATTPEHAPTSDEAPVVNGELRSIRPCGMEFLYSATDLNLAS